MKLTGRVRASAMAACGLAAIAAAAPAAHAASTYPDPLYPSTHDQQCERSASLIQGLGSSLQRTAQLNWGAEIVAPDPASPLAKGFGYDAGGCATYKLPADGGTKKITYAPSGSGAARTAFGAIDAPGGARNLTVDFGGTDDAPTATQLTNANEGPNVVAGSDSDDGVLNTIPVAQAGITVTIRIPDGCQIGSAAARQLSRTKVEGFFRGLSAFDQWYELFGTSNVKASAGSGLTDAQCQAKKPARVVRFDNSGSTFLFKKYLQEAAAGAFDWREPGQGGTLANNAWPSTTINAGVNGAGAQLDRLTAQDVNGGIAYADLASARGRNYGWDYNSGVLVPDDRTLWVRVQRISDSSYISPAKTDDQLGAKGARCTGVTYTNQPADTTGSWYDTTAVLTSTDYPICGLTYVLAWQSPTAVGINSLGRAVGRRDYIGYMLDRPGLGTTPSGSQCDPADPRYGKGQCKLPANDYARLPADIFTKAQAGAQLLGP